MVTIRLSNEQAKSIFSILGVTSDSVPSAREVRRQIARQASINHTVLVASGKGSSISSSVE